ncbi:YycH family regulatory protein [Halobacillus mangrovi]|uniref:YycH family regulatory protein n=1 Tax=Halobacillus mangrovi TaxID=402384 RepID=UPI003D991E6D
MNIETMKSVILVILIAFSLLLTVALWNYQPNFNQADENKDIGPTTLEKAGGEQVEIPNLVEPAKVVYQTQGSYYSYADPNDRSQLYEKMKQWALVNINDNPSPPELGEGDRAAEIIFPSELPLEVLNNIFSIKEDLPQEDALFDRIFVVHEHDSESVSPYMVYIMDTGEDVNPTKVSASLSEEAATQLFNEVDNHEMVSHFRLGDWSGGTDSTQYNHIYLPADKTSYPTEVLQTNNVPLTPLQNFLFPASSTIRQSYSDSVDRRYVETFRVLDVYNDERMMKYQYKITNQSPYWTQYELFNKSVNDMNNHFGWTNPFRLENILANKDTVRYRMYYNGIPIYEESGLSTISLKYEGSSIQEYIRPLVSFFPVPYENGEDSSVTIESGEQVISKIKESGIAIDDIDDIQVGYSLTEQSMRLAYSLLPQWYIKVDGEWTSLFRGEITQNKEVS